MARPRTIVYSAAGLLFGLLILAVGAVALLTQTARGRGILRQAVLPVIRTVVPGSLYIGRIGGNLFTNLTVDSLDLSTPDGTPFLRTGPVRLEYDVRDLLARRVVIRFVEVLRPVVYMVDYGNNDWNWMRALRRPGVRVAPRPTGPSLVGNLGDWIRVDSAEIIDGALTVVDPWKPVDSLRGAKRDSAVRFNLTRRDLEIIETDDRIVKIRRWSRGFVALGASRIAHPDSAGLRLAIRQLDAVETDPPFWFRNISGDVRIIQDSLWVDSGRIHLPRSGGTMQGKIVWGSGLPMRWDLKIRGDSVAFSDIAWMSPVLPHEGGGRTELHIRNDPDNVRVMQYIITKMDARALRSRLRGRMTFSVGDTLLRISDVGLDLEPMHTDMLKWMNAEPFPYDWRGAITGRVNARGGRVDRFQLDEARVAYTDEHVVGAVTRGTVSGLLDVYEPAFAVFKGVTIDLERLDLRTPRYVNPLFPDLAGILSGTMKLDSVWTDVRFSGAQLAHSDGPGDTTRLSGRGRITLLDDATAFDVDMTAAPLSYTTLARSYPGLPLRGLAVGPIRAQGTVDDFTLETALAGAGGEIAFTGNMDAFEPDFLLNGRLRVIGADVQALLADTAMPFTYLGFTADLDVRGASLATLAGSARAELSERSSRVGTVPVYTGTLALRFADARMQVDSLALESAAFRAVASGAVGLTAATRDTVRLRVNADSLGGLRELLRLSGYLADNAVALADSSSTSPLSGMLTMRAAIASSLDTLDTLGVHADVVAAARDVVVGTSSAGSVQLTATLDDVFGRVRGTGQLTVDSAQVAGINAEAMVANATLNDRVPSKFSASLRTTSNASIALSGGATRDADSVRVIVNQLDVFTPETPLVGVRRERDAGSRLSAPSRGFSLAWPVNLMLGPNGTGRVDSMLWQHSQAGSIALRGDILSDGRVNGVLDAENVPLADVGALVRPSAAWQGQLSSSLQLSGTRESPDFAGRLALRDARLGSVALGQLDATVRYDEQRVLADLSLLVDNKPALTASATLPLDLALVRGRQRLLDQPLSGRVTSQAVDLSVLESIFPSLQRGVGTLDTDIALAGTWERPRLTGQLSVADGAITIVPLDIRVQDVKADIRLAGDTIAIRQFSAQSGDAARDTMSLSGTVTIESLDAPVFDLQLSANSFLAIDRARYATLYVSTVRPVTLVGPRNNALLQGGVRVDRGRVFLNSLSQRRGLDLNDELNLIDTTNVRVDALLASAPDALVQGLSLQNVRLDIGDDVWLRSPEANIKLGGGLRLTRSLDPRSGQAQLALADSLTVQRGTYQLNLGLARPTFDVERGTIRFFGDPDLDPALDIAALHVVRQQRPNSNRQDVRIRVRMGGTLNEPTLTLSSADNPPLPESDMLSYLVTGEPAYALFGTAYSDQGATLALRLAGSYLSSRLAGGRFDLVQVEPTALNPGEASNLRQSGLGILAATRVGVGGQVGERTFLSVTTGLCGLAPQGAGSADPLSLFAQGLGVKLERQFDSRFSAALGIEPGSSASTCGRPGASRTFQQTPPQIGIDFFRSWSW